MLSVYHYLGAMWKPLVHAALARRLFLGELVEDGPDVLSVVCPDDPERHLEGTRLFSSSGAEDGATARDAALSQREAADVLAGLVWEEGSSAGDADRWAHLAPRPVHMAHQRRRRLAELEAYGYGTLHLKRVDGSLS